MLAIPPELARRYEARLLQQNIVTGVTVQTPPVSHGDGFRYAQPILRKNNRL